MNTTDLSELFRDATAGLEPPQDFTRHVLVGGRRRRLRRRLTMAASALAVLAVAAAGSIMALDPGGGTADLLHRPTQGALAGNQAFTDQVIGIWRSELSLAEENRFRFYDDLRGDPHVLWAGNTPAGRAAVVVQQTYIHQDYWVPAKRAGLWLVTGLVAIDPADSKLKLVGTYLPATEPAPASYFMFGPDDRTMLIVDQGKPLYYSDRYSDANVVIEVGMPYRPEWHRVQPHDGVALVSLHDGPILGQLQRIAYQGDHPPEEVDFGSKDVADIDPASGYLKDRLPNANYRIPIPNFFKWKDQWTFGTPVSGIDTNKLQFVMDDRIHSQWQVNVWLPDRLVIVKETQIDREKSRFDTNGSVLTVGIGRFVPGDLDVRMTDVERVEHDAVLPIKYRIPDGGGWVVANKGKALSYRVQGGQWQDAGRDAALLPDNAVEVKVGDDVVRL